MMHRMFLGVVAVLAALTGPTSGLAAAQETCGSPLVHVLSEGEAAVSRPALRSPSEYALSNVYALNQVATRPQYTYAEAGPQYTGAFEALAPSDTPPPPRAVAAFPSEDIPDDDEEVWGGTSVTGVTSTSATASSSAANDIGIDELLGMDGGNSFVSTVVDCETVTIVAGWSVSDITLAPGLSFQQLGETVTLVVGPEGSSADVDTTAIRSDGLELPLEGRPLDPITDPIRENGGPTVEAGEPRTETGDGYAAASGGGFNFLFLDPEAGQGAGFRIGSVEATINVLGQIPPPREFDDGDEETPGAITVPPAQGPTTVGTDSDSTGTPPAPSEQAAASIDAQLVRNTTATTLEVGTTNWLPLWAFVATAALAVVYGGGVAVGRTTYPTLDWIARRSLRSASRFASLYLRW